MKVYINNFNISILNHLLHLFHDKYINSETFIQIYSIDGIYKINETHIKKQNIIDKDIELYKNYYNNYTLIIDKSVIIEEDSYSVHPEHVYIKLKKCFFKINNSSPIQLVIEGALSEGKSLNDYCINPNDIYFEMMDNINIMDDLIKKEINVFLSQLN